MYVNVTLSHCKVQKALECSARELTVTEFHTLESLCGVLWLGCAFLCGKGSRGADGRVSVVCCTCCTQNKFELLGEMTALLQSPIYSSVRSCWETHKENCVRCF